MRLVIADCVVDYTGRLEAHLPLAKRLIIIKDDGSVLVHADGGSYKPLNWMSPPCSLRVLEPAGDEDAPVQEIWEVSAKKKDGQLRIQIHKIHLDETQVLGPDPGLVKDGVEAHLQKLLAEQVEILGQGWRLVRREYPTPIGPVDLMVRDANGAPVAVEVKRRGEIDGVEQLTRYLDLLRRDSALSGITGIFAAQQIRPQARVLAEDRGIRCVILDYDLMRGLDDSSGRLF